MDQENMFQKIMSLVPSKRRLKSQCIPTQSESEANKDLEDFVKTYDPAMASIQYHLTQAPSKGILKRSEHSYKHASDASEIADLPSAAPVALKDMEDNTDEEEAPILFPTIKDSLEILLKKKSSITTRKSILKNPSKTSNLASTMDMSQTSDDDEIPPVSKFPAKDSMEILIKSKSGLKVTRDDNFDNGDKTDAVANSGAAAAATTINRH
ncbi:hypothetical protein WDU94_011843 [Cyamophila willieti]